MVTNDVTRLGWVVTGVALALSGCSCEQQPPVDCTDTTLTLEVGGASVTGTVSGNRATFAGVTAGAGPQTLTATITNGTRTKKGRKSPAKTA